VLEGRTRSGKDRFKLDQVVFTYKQYLRLILKLRMGKPIIFDEPSYAMGKRDWYKELNKALVLTIESQRFKVHPLFIPIINKALLDKTLRSYLIQFQIEMRDRGNAIAYRIYPSQHTEKIYRYTFCKLEYEMFDNHLCKRDSCLDCSYANEIVAWIVANYQDVIFFERSMNERKQVYKRLDTSKPTIAHLDKKAKNSHTHRLLICYTI